MRLVLALLVAFGMMATAADRTQALAADTGSAVVALQQPGQYEIDIDVGGGGGAWWGDPIWIGAGVVVLILLIVIVALASRGGGTTVIKD